MVNLYQGHTISLVLKPRNKAYTTTLAIIKTEKNHVYLENLNQKIMKNLKSLIIILTVSLTFVYCDKESENLNTEKSQELILGNWRISEFNVSKSSSSENFVYDNFSNDSFDSNAGPIFLSFWNNSENNEFIKNYVTGSWNIKNEEISLNPNENLNTSSENYEITEVTENSLTLKIQLMKKDYLYSWYFTDFNSNDLIYITEKYIRK